MSSRARYDGETREVHIRIAQLDREIYVDLANDAWRVVKVSADGWHVISPEVATVRFRRSKGMLALPDPVPGCVIDALRGFVNVTDQQ